MAVNINSFKVFVEYIMNKVQNGNSFSVSEFNSLCDRSQMQLYEKDNETFVKTEDISDFLKNFLVSTLPTVDSDGNYTLPVDSQHLTSVRKYYVRENGKGFNVKVDEVKNLAYTSGQTPGLHEATLRFPKYEQFGKGLKFLPKNIGIVEIDYLRTPVKPFWNFTIVNGRPLYNSIGSIDFEWDEFSFNQVAAIFLSLIGCNLKDNELVQFSEMYKQQTNSEL